MLKVMPFTTRICKIELPHKAPDALFSSVYKDTEIREIITDYIN